MIVITRPDAELEEWLSQEIPCGGLGPGTGRQHYPCPYDAPAVVRRMPGCPCGKAIRPSWFKCADCYLSWRARVEAVLAVHVAVRCFDCKTLHYSVDSLSRYVPF
jgi:hypothetical protein